MAEHALFRFASLRSVSAEKAVAAVLSALGPARQAHSSNRQVRVTFSEHVVTVFDVARDESEQVVRIALADAEQGVPAIHQSKIAALASGETIVVLSPTEALRRTVQLPIGAAGNLRDLLRHEIDRHSPIDPGQIYFDYWVTLRDKAANKLDVELRIVKRASIDRAIGICRCLGLEPVSVEIDGDLIPLQRSQLPLNRRAVTRSVLRRWSNPALLILVFVLAVATVTTATARKELALSLLDARIDQAAVKASVVQRLRNEIAGAEKRATFLLRARQNPMAVQVLLELTRAIPDGTWVYSFQLNGQEVRIRGLSPAASSLIGVFDKSGFFANAQFRAPLTQSAQSGVEHFDLSVDVTGKEG